MGDLKVKINDTWKNTDTAYVKVNGTWKEGQTVYTKVNGIWIPGWDSAGAIKLGSGKTFDIKTLLPNIDYTSLTIDNFAMLDNVYASYTSYISANYSTTNGGCMTANNPAPTSGTWPAISLSMSYNKSTGILTGNLGGQNITPVFIKNPSKALLQLSTSTATSFDVKSKYPNVNYSKLTVNNFVIKAFNSGTDTMACCCSPSCPIGNWFPIAKTYNTNTGVLSWYGGSHRHGNPGVIAYLILKVADLK